MRFLLSLLFVMPSGAASLFTAASEEYGTNAVPASLTAAYPMTIALRVYVTATNVVYAFASVGTTTSARQGIFQSNNGTWQAISHDGTGSSAASIGTAAAGVVVNTWYHVVARFDAANDRELFINGTSVATQGSTRTQVAPTVILAGARYSSGTLDGAYHNGGLCDFAVWNVALTDEEIASLANYAAAPTDIRMASLVFYAPMLEGLTTHTINYCGSPMIYVNTPSSTAHPKVVLP